MRRSMIAAVLALGAVTIPATAYAAGHAADAPVNWQSRTCKAAAAYGKHPTQAGLVLVLGDALRLKGKSYLEADALEWGATMKSPSPKAGRYAATDWRYLMEDCAKVAVTTVG